MTIGQYICTPTRSSHPISGVAPWQVATGLNTDMPRMAAPLFLDQLESLSPYWMTILREDGLGDRSPADVRADHGHRGDRLYNPPNRPLTATVCETEDHRICVNLSESSRTDHEPRDQADRQRYGVASAEHREPPLRPDWVRGAGPPKLPATWSQEPPLGYAVPDRLLAASLKRKCHRCEHCRQDSAT